VSEHKPKQTSRTAKRSLREVNKVTALPVKPCTRPELCPEQMLLANKLPTTPLPRRTIWNGAVNLTGKLLPAKAAAGLWHSRIPNASCGLRGQRGRLGGVAQASSQLMRDRSSPTQSTPSSSSNGAGEPPLFIGVAGGTASGKTSLCAKIMKQLEAEMPVRFLEKLKIIIFNFYFPSAGHITSCTFCFPSAGHIIFNFIFLLLVTSLRALFIFRLLVTSFSHFLFSFCCSHGFVHKTHDSMGPTLVWLVTLSE
jgi:hypothetical protein